MFFGGQIGAKFCPLLGRCNNHNKSFKLPSPHKVPGWSLTCHVASSHNRNFDKFFLFTVIFLPF